MALFVSIETITVLAWGLTHSLHKATTLSVESLSSSKLGMCGIPVSKKCRGIKRD